ncbi:molybdopterin-dependent oxidoreductase [Streptomyces sp. NBC_01343]|uniref:xanthine dehydrogenase family protein molybdopterin-binding subunit n=1 Tax=Streptomyces sp. NBC_01343 TaxID=2903832 RepID=UPI002E13F321|nr:molybdopterin-dependent oxidoreductase [Streptomyces sp. NBC_01343]
MTRRSVGAALPRREARAKVTGSARYTGDVTRPHLAYAAVVPAEVAHGRVTAVHPGEALARSGVLAVIHGGNCPRLNRTGGGDLAVFQSPSVAYRGQFVAAVVAESPQIAHEAARTVRVDYVANPHRVSLDVACDGFRQPPDRGFFFPTDCWHGDVETALSQAPVRVDATYRTPPYHHHALEPHATVAYWQDGALTVHDTTQGPSGTRDILARLFGIGPERVRVFARHVGGGFGSKAAPRAQVVVAALAALAVGRPVKTALTREQLSVVAGYRKATVQRIMGLSMALCEEGVIDRTYGHFHSRDLSAYHVGTFADAPEIEAVRVEEEDFHTSPMGDKGVGEIGIVGTAAAIAHAVHHTEPDAAHSVPVFPEPGHPVQQEATRIRLFGRGGSRRAQCLTRRFGELRGRAPLRPGGRPVRGGRDGLRTGRVGHPPHSRRFPPPAARAPARARHRPRTR